MAILLMGLVSGLAACDGREETASSSSPPSRVGLPEDASLRDVLESGDMLVRVERVAKHLQSLGPDDLERTREAFETAALDRGDLEYTLFAEWWARFDPEAAMAWTDGNLQTQHPRVIAAVVRRWAANDPEGAVASGRFYQVQTGAPVYRADLLDALVVGWFDSGRPGLEEFLQGLGMNDLPRGLQTYARRRALRDGFRETLEWSREAPGFDDAAQRLLMAGTLTVVAMQEPLLAVEYLKVAEEDGVDVRSFVPRIASSWGELDHQAALEWLATVEPGPDRNSGISRVAGIWVRKDEESLGRWIAERDGEEWLDMVRVLRIKRTINMSGYDEIDWAEMLARTDEIVDRERGYGLLAWIAQRWMVVDEPAAREWLDEKSDLPEVWRERSKQISPATRLQVESALAERGSG